ncbi:MAG: pilus assembly protein PilZ [Treponema sp.]|nr:pilus assembly protein PilZ [Treponema sp.]MCL2236947.1 pilus assembly protein PilZ [Treponema sp.]
MGVLTSQKINVYYDRFKDIDVTFTKDMIQVTGLLTQQVHLKCGNDFWPCVVYTTSFSGAKVVANIKTGLLGKIQATNNFVNLRFCFRPPGESNTVTFFVAARVMASAPYGNSQDVNMFTVQFSNRPPDDFIEIIGRVLDANVNSAKRKDDRIPLTADNLRKLNILSTETAVFIQQVPRRCILRDVSFSGSKLIMMGVSKFLLDKEASIRIDFNDPRESYTIKGKFVRAEDVEGKKEMVALALNFDENAVPMGYKIRLNDMLTSTSAADRIGTTEEEPAAAK